MSMAGVVVALRMAASGTPDVEPDWLVIDLTLSLWPDSDETGLQPDQTALYAEGCAEIDAISLLEAWARHTLVGINTWTDSGTAQIHREWQGHSTWSRGRSDCRKSDWHLHRP